MASFWLRHWNRLNVAEDLQNYIVEESHVSKEKPILIKMRLETRLKTNLEIPSPLGKPPYPVLCKLFSSRHTDTFWIWPGNTYCSVFQPFCCWSVLLQPHRIAVANFGLFRWNPWQPLAQPCLKNTDRKCWRRKPAATQARRPSAPQTLLCPEKFVLGI